VKRCQPEWDQIDPKTRKFLIAAGRREDHKIPPFLQNRMALDTQSLAALADA
jgi:hypothetical protein